MNNVFFLSTQLTQHSSLLIFRQFRLSLKCSQSRRLKIYKDSVVSVIAAAIIKLAVLQLTPVQRRKTLCLS